MIFLLIIATFYFVIGIILNISLNETVFLMGFVLIFLITVVIHGLKTLGLREFLVFFIIAYSITLLYEYTEGLGFGTLANCIPYYSNVLGPKFFDKIPYIIPLVWSLALYCSFTMTNIIFNRLKTYHRFEENISGKWFLKIIGMGIITGLIMASWDLINDPVMVKIGAWNWSYSGSYYGIPLWNYETWVEIPTLVFLLFSYYLFKIKKRQKYIGGEKQSNYTFFVVILYLTLLIIYGVYAVFEDVLYSIPWAVITMGPIAAVTMIRFYRFKSK
jgi:putative membrane protein